MLSRIPDTNNLYTLAWFQVFLSNTNNLHTVLCFQVFLSNTNNLQAVLCFQVFLSNTNLLCTVVWLQVFLSNTNNSYIIIWFLRNYLDFMIIIHFTLLYSSKKLMIINLFMIKIQCQNDFWLETHIHDLSFLYFYFYHSKEVVVNCYQKEARFLCLMAYKSLWVI